MLYRIIQQNDQHLLRAVRVSVYIRDIFRQIQADGHSAILCRVFISFRHVIKQLTDAHTLFCERDRAGLQAGKLQEIINQPGKPHGFFLDISIVPDTIFFFFDKAITERIGKAADRSKRRAQLMRNVCDIIPARLLQAYAFRNILYKKNGAFHRAAAIPKRRNRGADHSLPAFLFHNMQHARLEHLFHTGQQRRKSRKRFGPFSFPAAKQADG